MNKQIVITDLLPYGCCIDGYIVFNGIIFNVQLRFDGPLEHQAGSEYCLKILQGKKDWNDSDEYAKSGHSYFGDDKHSVRAYEIDQNKGEVIVFLEYSLYKKGSFKQTSILKIYQDNGHHLIENRKKKFISSITTDVENIEKLFYLNLIRESRKKGDEETVRNIIEYKTNKKVSLLTTISNSIDAFEEESLMEIQKNTKKRKL